MSYKTWDWCPPPVPGRDAVGAEAAGGPLHRDVRFRADYVCLSPNSRHSGQGWECLKLTHSGSRGLPIRDTLPEGFSHFVTSMTAPVASGWSDSCRVRFAPTG